MKRFTMVAILGLGLACNRSPVTLPEPQGTPLAVQPKSAILDPGLPAYAPASPQPLTGTLVSFGSDSMEPLMLGWRDDFTALHPGVRFTFECKGSGTAPQALIASRCSMGHMSREMNAAELEKFQATFGYAPTRIVVAADALAIYVNANNPIRQITLGEVDAIFSTTRKGGHGAVTTWGDLGLTDMWQNRAIQPYGRDENSGTRAFFLDRVLGKGALKPTVRALPDQFAVVEAAAIDAAGISYGPFQHSIRMVRSVPVVDFNGTQPVPATVENVLGGKYPLTRFLYIYLNHKPGTPMDPLTKAFMTFVLSRDGQKSVADFGAVPLPADMAAMNAARLK